MNFFCVFWKGVIKYFVIYNIVSFEIRLIQFHRNWCCFWEICYERCRCHFSLGGIIKRNWLSEVIINWNTLVILFSVFYDNNWSNKCLLVKRRKIFEKHHCYHLWKFWKSDLYFWVFVQWKPKFIHFLFFIEINQRILFEWF